MAHDPQRMVEKLGKQIAQLRRQRKLSQVDLATKIRTTPQWVSQLERGVGNPTIGTLCKVADALEITFVALFKNAEVKTARLSTKDA